MSNYKVQQSYLLIINDLNLDSSVNALQIQGTVNSNINNGIVETTIDIYNMSESNRNKCLAKKKNEITLFLNQTLAFDGYIINSDLRKENNYTHIVFRLYCHSYIPPADKLIYSKNNTSYAAVIQEFASKTNTIVAIQDKTLLDIKSKINLKADNLYKAVEKIKKATGTKALFNKNEIKFISSDKKIKYNQILIPPKKILLGGLSTTALSPYGKFYINCKYTPVSIGDHVNIENSDYVKLSAANFTFPLIFRKKNEFKVLAVTHEFDYYGGRFETKIEGM